jgi:hypothetical protein
MLFVYLLGFQLKTESYGGDKGLLARIYEM